MEIHLAGVISKRSSVELYLARENQKKKILTENTNMNIYLAGEHPVKNGQYANWNDINILESFYYLRKNAQFPRLIKTFGNFLLDSGTFTFLSSGKSVDFEAYLEEYAAFIKKWGVKNFFELDIDPIVGIKEVERMRTKLIDATGRKPIPVWHKNRGKEYFIEMCKNYPYVAIGGIVTKEFPIRVYEKMFPWFITTAHKYNCKIHALGYTHIKGLYTYKFDSVDSTAWLYGNCGGFLYKFDIGNNAMRQINIPAGKRLKPREAAAHNFSEWIRFMKYARIYL